MRLAHIVLAHSRPVQLARLVRRLTLTGDLVLLHIDRRRPLAPFTAALERASVRPDDVVLLPRFRSGWGAFGLVDATLAGIAAALSAEPRADYVALHSGQDYPIKPREQIGERLEQAAGAAFLEHLAYPAPGFPDRGGLDRVERFYLRPSRRWSLPNRVVPFVPLRRLPHGLAPFGGSQFWWLPRDVAADVGTAVRDHPELRRFFRRSFVADETFFSTLVMNGPARERVVNDDLRFIDHPPGEAHPRTLTAADLPSLRGGADLFARKFDLERDPGILDAVDRELLGDG